MPRRLLRRKSGGPVGLKTAHAGKARMGAECRRRKRRRRGPRTTRWPDDPSQDMSARLTPDLSLADAAPDGAMRFETIRRVRLDRVPVSDAWTCLGDCHCDSHSDVAVLVSGLGRRRTGGSSCASCAAGSRRLGSGSSRRTFRGPGGASGSEPCARRSPRCGRPPRAFAHPAYRDASGRCPPRRTRSRPQRRRSSTIGCGSAAAASGKTSRTRHRPPSSGARSASSRRTCRRSLRALPGRRGRRGAACRRPASGRPATGTDSARPAARRREAS